MSAGWMQYSIRLELCGKRIWRGEGGCDLDSGEGLVTSGQQA